jgi:hypothetical protein
MRLIRFRKEGNEKPGIILPDDDQVEVSDFGEDYHESFLLPVE